MIEFKRMLRRLPNYMRRFGVLGGVAMALQIERRLPRSANSIRQFIVPGWPSPVCLRDSIGDHATFWQCVVVEQYQINCYPQAERLMKQYESSLRRGEVPLIIDCGANVGLASIWFANAFPLARIIAVEPDQENFALLQQNVEPYGERILPLHGGIWPNEDHVRIENPDAGSAAFRVIPCSPDHPGAVRTFTIPSLCARVGAEHPFIVKVDIEGAQGSLFSRNTDWVGDSALIVLELDDWQLPWVGTSRPFFSAISRWPFDYLLGGESIFCFRDFGVSPAGNEVSETQGGA